MRLRKILLAGFKSFMEPTAIQLPGELIGVVGPNGCGKSNVIDAVRWVMGESSARHLRGDQMADVIFNGSSSRQPLGQASVELVFDNTEGRLGGQYSAYSEIAIRRTVRRDSQSIYFLNGTRCRRRDIVDIFLGTGLGPRSYAIIEQGTISRLIEARPEELREFLEEAAGISKYKERRRETENRIRHTRENLDRLDDLREELNKRLQHLKRQASTAERYREFKAQERHLRGELLGLRWRDLNTEVIAQERQSTSQENQVDAVVTTMRRVQAEAEKSRARHIETSERFNTLYRSVLEANLSVRQTEELMQNLRERREQLRASLEKEGQAHAEAVNLAAEDARGLNTLLKELAQAEPRVECFEVTTKKAHAALEGREQSLGKFLSERSDFNRRLLVPAQQIETEQTRMQSAEEWLSGVVHNLERLETEETALEAQDKRVGLATLAQLIARTSENLLEVETSLTAEREHTTALRTEVRTAESDLHETRQRLEQLRGRQASLETLQEEVLVPADEEILRWLEAEGLNEAERLGQRLQVLPGWEQAIEIVLENFLEGICVTDPYAYLCAVSRFSGGALTLLRLDDEESLDKERDKRRVIHRLSDAVISGPAVIRQRLSAVYVALDVNSAQALSESLKAHESVITPDGLWFGPGWVRRVDGNQRGLGVLVREEQRRETEQAIQTVLSQVSERDEILQNLRNALQDSDTKTSKLENERSEIQKKAERLNAEEAAHRGAQEQRGQRLNGIRQEREELTVLASEQRELLREARNRLSIAYKERQRLEEQEGYWAEQHQHLETQLQEARAAWETIRDDTYQMKLRVESLRTQCDGLRVGRERLLRRLTEHEERLNEIKRDLSGIDTPLQEAGRRLSESLKSHRTLERQLSEVRTLSEAAESEVRTLERQREECEREVKRETETLNGLRMHTQATKVRCEALLEQMLEAGHPLDEVLDRLDPEASEVIWIDKIGALEKRIERLGPINLVAIEEFETASERLDFLNTQHDDLAQALETLASVIQKIDRETRGRFKETYEKVNYGLQRRFPRLFGGGSADLVLTGDDLLSTGVSVMASPPGKRNSSITQLSGGEKALTAVALVFAIFDLNPSPFCLLDEVDASLDDTNIERFGALVREMSEQVQVLFVTHNKGTMEVAQQLLGVTMNEPGVSRLVAVDMDEALKMIPV